MSFPIYDRDPNSVLDYKWDWSQWLQVGETISSHQVVPAIGINVDSSTHDTTSVTAWISGGTAGTVYNVIARITTNQGRTDDRTIRLRTKEA